MGWAADAALSALFRLDPGWAEKPDAASALGQIRHPLPQLKAITLKLPEELLTKITVGAKAREIFRWQVAQKLP